MAIKEVELEDDMAERSVYLRHEKEPSVILGLHSIGYRDVANNWCAEQSWCNVYDTEFKFQYSSHRIFGPLEDELKGYTDGGWKEVEHETIKKTD